MQCHAHIKRRDILASKAWVGHHHRLHSVIIADRSKQNFDYATGFVPMYVVRPSTGDHGRPLIDHRLDCVLISRFIINLQELAVNDDTSPSKGDEQTHTRTSMGFTSTFMGNIGSQLRDSDLYDMDEDSTIGEEMSDLSVAHSQLSQRETVELGALSADQTVFADPHLLHPSSP